MRPRPFRHGDLSPMYLRSSSVTNRFPTNTSSCPPERSTATFAIVHRTSSSISSTNLCCDMSTDRHRCGALAASSHEWHARPAPMRTSTAPSLPKTDARTSRGSSDQSLAPDGGGSGRTASVPASILPWQQLRTRFVLSLSS
uniref:Uncharacterized protein n=1 Tax=Arundo donax TaxID=35708 RepID=A0A0A9BDZ9_ARUDO